MPTRVSWRHVYRPSPCHPWLRCHRALLADHARHDAGAAAWRIGRDEADRAVGVVLLGQRRRCEQRAGEQRKTSEGARRHNRTGAGGRLGTEATVRADKLAALLAERKRLREALTKCEEQFSLYAREHRRKERASRFNGISFFADESARKAITNEESAAMAREVLGGKP